MKRSNIVLHLILEIIGLYDISCIDVWRTVFLVQRGTGENIWSFYNEAASFRDDVDLNPDKNLRNPSHIAADGNYKSNIFNKWSTRTPKKIRLALHNDNGGLLWHMTFNGSETTKDPASWFTVERLISSLDTTIMDKKLQNNLVLIFNQDTISVQQKDQNTWLHTSWLTASSGPEIAFSSSRAIARTKLADVSYLPNNQLVLQTTNMIYYNVVADNRAICTTTRYIYGIGIENSLTASTSIDYVRFQTSTEKTCYAGLLPYRNKFGEEEVFRPNSTKGVNYVFPVATTKFNTLRLDYTSRAYGNKIYRFEWRGGEFIPASILTIQWSEDSVATTDQFQYLIVDDESTSKRRRRYTSASDNRGSVIVFGFFGIVILLAIIIIIVMLDVATLHRHLRFMKKNTFDCRQSSMKKLKVLQQKFTKYSNQKNKDKPSESAPPKTSNKKAQDKIRKVVNVSMARNSMKGERVPKTTLVIDKPVNAVPTISVTSTSLSVNSTVNKNNTSRRGSTLPISKRGSMKVTPNRLDTNYGKLI
ncbi:uncharacterized protein LOC126814916 [Patella vulgata]|uniref:uncharacterized protein LOC126814916 n=1 Tax=Patella vulgata TaxID=6465 RepID=UPI00218008E7|nr:uncharacterized protein LOC126814916 [Patella vulgata]